jgi:hypothetical protein
VADSAGTAYLINRPLALWASETKYVVSNVCDPQDKAKPIAEFPKTDEGRAHALLFKQVLTKYRNEYESRFLADRAQRRA